MCHFVQQVDNEIIYASYICKFQAHVSSFVTFVYSWLQPIMFVCFCHIRWWSLIFYFLESRMIGRSEFMSLTSRCSYVFVATSVPDSSHLWRIQDRDAIALATCRVVESASEPAARGPKFAGCCNLQLRFSYTACVGSMVLDSIFVLFCFLNIRPRRLWWSIYKSINLSTDEICHKLASWYQNLCLKNPCESIDWNRLEKMRENERETKVSDASAATAALWTVPALKPFLIFELQVDSPESTVSSCDGVFWLLERWECHISQGFAGLLMSQRVLVKQDRTIWLQWRPTGKRYYLYTWMVRPCATSN